MATEQPPPVRLNHSVLHAADALTLLADAAPDTMTLGEIAQALGSIAPSTAHLVMQSLRTRDLVEKTRHGHYQLGLGAIRIGGNAQRWYDLKARLAPPMEELAAKTREAISLSVLHHGDALIAMRFESDQILRATIGVGTRMPLLRSASGRCLIAFAPEAERSALLKTTKPRDRKAAREARRRVPEIRETGFETQLDEWADGVAAIAMPVTSDHPPGGIIGALSVSSPSSRFEPDPWIEPLRRTADTLTTMITDMDLDPWLMVTLIGQT